MTDTATLPLDRTVPILEGAKRAFAEKGFDGASMQDLARAAGMSAGNFYRYFASKNAIVEAIIAHDLAEVEADFQHIIRSDDPLQYLMQALTSRIDGARCAADGPLWAEILAAAARRPEIAGVLCTMETAVISNLLAIFGRVSGLTGAAAAARFSGHAAFIVFLLKGAMQYPANETCQVPQKLRSDLREQILSTMQQTLNDVASAATQSTD